MHPLLKVDIEQISISERMQLVEAIWDSILASPERLPVTNEQKEVLAERLEKHQLKPTEGSSWQVVRDRLGSL